MNKPAQPNLTKTCLNCGQQKPLTAFLEMSVSHGTAYGNVCATCRKTAMEAAERRKKTEAEGSTTSETGHKIDSKSKIHHDIDNREHQHRTEETYHEERKLDEEISEEKIERKEQHTKTEKKHREDFLRKRAAAPATKKFGEGLVIKSAAEETNMRRDQHNEIAANQNQGSQEERKKTEHDFTVAYQGQQIAGQIRFSGQAFQQFRQWLGNSAPIVNNINQTTKEAAPKQTGQIAQAANQMKDSEATPAKNPAPSDPVTEFIEKNWRPGGKR
jgi:hypothetical protein